jgi:hypothetical protein
VTYWKGYGHYRYIATSIKRVRCKWPEKKTLHEYIEGINKKVWLIKKPEDKDMFQWTFLFGTNFANLDDWKKEGFYSLNSSEGMEILRKLDCTKYELEVLKKFDITKQELEILKKFEILKKVEILKTERTYETQSRLGV